MAFLKNPVIPVTHAHKPVETIIIKNRAKRANKLNLVPFINLTQVCG